VTTLRVSSLAVTTSTGRPTLRVAAVTAAPGNTRPGWHAVIGGVEVAAVATVYGVHAVTGAPTAKLRVSAVTAEADPAAPVQSPIPNTDAGALVIGSTTYTLPPDATAVYVSPTGSATGDGSPTNPVSTLATAINLASVGDTVVLREGTYHEGTTNSDGLGLQVGKAITIQPYPGEEVWMDGSVVVGGWTKSPTSNVWSVNFSTSIDRSPTFTRGADDSATPGFGFINPSFPFAAFAEQVWVDGQALTHVGSAAAVTAGTFFVEGSYVGGTGTNRKVFNATKYYIGADPTGKEVRIANLTQAVILLADNAVLRGIGVRKYATCVADFGAVKAWRAGCAVENVQVEDCSAIGASIGSRTNIVGRRITALRNGLLGIHSNNGDGLEIDRVRCEFNNTRRFNFSPVCGGLKITRCRNISVHHSVFANNYGKGYWSDESVYNCTFYRNDVYDNEHHGAIFELSGLHTIVDNLIVGNGVHGLYCFNIDHIRAWNNTVVDNGATAGGGGRNCWVNSDTRAPMQSGSTGRDTRYAFPDPSGMNWLVVQAQYRNNVYGRIGAGGTAEFAIIDSSNNPDRAAEDFGPDLSGNYYNRLATNQPGTLITWQTAGTNAPATSYTSLSAFRTAKPTQESGSLATDGADILGPDYQITATFKATADAAAVALPADIAVLAAQAAGTKHSGCWR
jgi:trimeric autotransporter adhesin